MIGMILIVTDVLILLYSLCNRPYVKVRTHRRAVLSRKDRGWAAVLTRTLSAVRTGYTAVLTVNAFNNRGKRLPRYVSKVVLPLLYPSMFTVTPKCTCVLFPLLVSFDPGCTDFVFCFFLHHATAHTMTMMMMNYNYLSR